MTDLALLPAAEVARRYALEAQRECGCEQGPHVAVHRTWVPVQDAS